MGEDSHPEDGSREVVMDYLDLDRTSLDGEI